MEILHEILATSLQIKWQQWTKLTYRHHWWAFLGKNGKTEIWLVDQQTGDTFHHEAEKI